MAPTARLDEVLLKEAGMTIYRHTELNWNAGGKLESNEITHDWARLLSKDLLNFDNIIHEKDEALSDGDRAYINNGRKNLMIQQSEFPTCPMSQAEFVRKWPQAGLDASQRHHLRAVGAVNRFKDCAGKHEKEWQHAFRILLDGIEGKVDPLKSTHPGLPWLQSLEEIRIDGELEWINGQKELERNRLRNPVHRDIQLTYPKPDNQISFAIRSDTAERSDRRDTFPMRHNCIFRHLQDDPVVNNFSYSTLRGIAYDIREADSPPFCFVPAWSATSEKEDSDSGLSSNPASIACFPWLICEHKRQPKQRVDEQAERQGYEEDGERKKGASYCQAANACAVSLTILARLVSQGSFELVNNDARHHVRPVFAITSVGEKASIWVAYISKIEKGTLNFEMHKIWYGSLYNYVNVLELSIFLDRVHCWAVKSLKPWISSCIDHWRYFMREDPHCNSIQNKKSNTIGVAGWSNIYVTNDAIDERRSENQELGTSSRDISHFEPEPTVQPRKDLVIRPEQGTRSTIEQDIESGDHLHQAQSTARQPQVLGAAAKPILIDQPATSEIQSDQPRVAWTFDPSQRSSTSSQLPDSPNANTAPGAKVLNEGAHENPSMFVFGGNSSPPIASRTYRSIDRSGNRIASLESSFSADVLPANSYGTHSLTTRDESISNHSPTAIPTDLHVTGNTNQLQLPVRVPETSQKALVLYKEPAFQDILTRGDNLLLDIEYSLRAEQPTDLTKRYIEIAEKTSPLESFRPHYIALLGGSGVGKSSLINALLGLGFLVPANTGGGAVTRFAAEYYHDPNIEDEFWITVEYQSKAEIRDTIKSLVADYRNSRQTGEAEKEPNDLTEKRRDAAESALDVLFKAKTDWQGTCDNSNKIPYQTAVDEMTAWIENFTIDLDQASSLRINTVSACNRELETLGMGNLWPLIKTVRVCCRSAEIDEGIVLLDLPGLRDTNNTRVKMTETQILRADHVFLVAGIERVETCSNFRADLRSLLALKRQIGTEGGPGIQKRKREIKVTIVCTKTDTLKYDQLKASIRNTMTANNLGLLKEMEDQLVKAKNEGNTKLIRDLKSKLQDLCITTKIPMIRAGIQGVIQKTKCSQLNASIFLVSTEECKISKHNGECLLCEIPQLRKHCSELIAGDRLQNAKDFVECMLPGLIAIMRSWYDGQRQDKASEQKDHYSLLKTILTRARRSLRMACDDYRSKLELPWSSLIRNLLQNHCKQWDTTSKEAVKPWANLHVRTHLACCRRGGMAFEPTSGNTNRTHHWNKDLLQPLTTTVSISWAAAEQETSKTLQFFLERVQSSLATLENSIKSSQSRMRSDATNNLLTAVSKSIKESGTDLRNLEADLNKQLAFLRKLVLEDESPSSIIATIMRPTYQAAADAYGGRNCRKEQQQIIVKTVNDGIFEAFVEKFSDEISRIISSNIETAQTIVDRVRNDLRMLEKDLSINNQAHPHNRDAQLYRMLDKHLKDWEIEAQKLSGECRTT